MALGLGMVMGLVVGLGVDGMQPMVLYLSRARRCEKWDVESGMWEVFEYGGGLVWAFAMSQGGYVVERRGSYERKVALNHCAVSGR